MKTNQSNRMQTNSASLWAVAKTEMVSPPPERAILCPQCGSSRTKTRVTRPQAGISQMFCAKCGYKFAARNIASHFPETRPLNS